MFNRLTTRLVLSHLLVIAISMTLLSFVMLSLVQGYFEQALQQSLLTQARLTAQALISSETITQTITSPAQNVLQQQTNQFTAQVQNVSPSLSDTTIRLGTEFDTRVRVIDTRGIVQADSAGTDRGKNLANDSIIAAALRGQEQTRKQDDWIFVAVPFRRAENIVGAVYLGQPMNDVAAVLTDMRLRLLVSAAISLVLSALVGLILARAIARPVRELTRAANQLAQGNFDYPLEARSTDELGELARAFRSMSHDLQRTLQARTDLVSNVSHELRTPLTAIKGLVETLRDGAVDDLDARDKFLASIEGETDRLIRLVNDLLILSRADSHALTLDWEWFDVAGLARACVQELSASATAQHVTLAIDSPPTLVHADHDRIRQVLINLLDNAIRYSPAGETVRVDVSSTPTEVSISIQDRGPGIPLADQVRVFERFYRADKSRVRDSQGAAGAGLGLSIAQTLVQAHGGHIELISREGQGTTVRFTLPAA